MLQTMRPYEGLKDKFEEIQSLAFDCYKADPQLISVIGNLVRACNMITEELPDTFIEGQLESATNGLKKYKDVRLGSH